MTETTLRVDIRQLSRQFEMFPAEAVVGVARDLDKRYNPTIHRIQITSLTKETLKDFFSRGVYFSCKQTYGY